MTAKDPISWTTREIIDATGAELLCGEPDRQFAGVSIDSRNITPTDVFVAIVGEVHDGHDFATKVIEQGIQGVVIDKSKAAELPVSKWRDRNIACAAVDDTTRALGDLAAFHRKRMPASVIAITGSNGKTTTRKLTTGVVASKFKTLSTQGNYNNDIGLPLTLLRMHAGHTWAVVELGTNSPGEIARLAEICSPDIGVITNIGPAHLEKLGTLDGVLREKGDLLKQLRSDGKAVLNADDRRLLRLASKIRKPVVLFGSGNDAIIRAEAVKEKTTGISFDLVLPTGRVSVNLSTAGQFMVANALAAAAVGYLIDLSARQIKQALEDFHPVPGRMNVFQTKNGIHVIDDTYNANPDSMKVAIGTLQTLSANHRKIFIAGDMLELGDQSEALHQQVGHLAAAAGIGRIYITGEFAEAVACGAQDAQMNGRYIFTGSKDEILEDLKHCLKPGDWVLIKGSRGMAMETIVEGLKEWAGIKPAA
jgi:UDP-N-acetylmuramoyl-tripeptide--D-alanyl-D-alanine ligase